MTDKDNLTESTILPGKNPFRINIHKFESNYSANYLRSALKIKNLGILQIALAQAIKQSLFGTLIIRR